MIFDNLTSPPDKLNGCVDNLTVLPINIFNYFYCHSEKNTTGGHTVVKPGRGNKARNSGWSGGSMREDANFKAQHAILHSGPGGPLGVWDMSANGISLRVTPLDSMMEISPFLGAVWKLIDLSHGLTTFFKGPLFRLCHAAATTSSVLCEGPPGPQVPFHSHAGSTGQSKKIHVWGRRGRGQPSLAFQWSSSKSIFSNVCLSCRKRGYPWRAEQTQKYSCCSLSREYKQGKMIWA